jgi:hypothetical protein
MLLYNSNIRTCEEVIELDAQILNSATMRKYKCRMNMKCTIQLKPKNFKMCENSRNKQSIDSRSHGKGSFAATKSLATASQHVSTVSSERTSAFDYYTNRKKIVNYKVRSNIKKPDKCNGDDGFWLKV